MHKHSYKIRRRTKETLRFECTRCFKRLTIPKDILRKVFTGAAAFPPIDYIENPGAFF